MISLNVIDSPGRAGRILSAATGAWPGKRTPATPNGNDSSGADVLAAFLNWVTAPRGQAL